MTGSDMTFLAENAQSGGGAFNLILLLLIPVAFYFLLIRPQSKRRREQMQMQSSIEPGARVLTTNGMYATVVSVDDDGLVLEIAEGVEARFVKQSIMQVLKDDKYDAEDLDEDEDEYEDEDEEAAEEVDEAGERVDLDKETVDLDKGASDEDRAEDEAPAKSRKKAGDKSEDRSSA